MNISEILEELNLENGSNYKLAVLKKYQDNALFKRVLEMTYDRVRFTYGITMKNIKYVPESGRPISLETALDSLENDFVTRNATGNAAIMKLEELLSNLSTADASILEKIIGRDLKVNIGRTNINKVFKDLIIKPFYMRCDTYSAKTAKNIKFPAILNLKADGTYRSVLVENGEVTFNSRSGEEYFYPVLEEQFKLLSDGVYVGELTIDGITDRAEGNGLLNSDKVPHDRVIIELWDYITLQEYSNAKGKNKIVYEERFKTLLAFIKESKNIKIIPYIEVNTIQEALKQTSEWMSEGFEGTILKDKSAAFKDGTSKQQLKLKLEISVEMRITGFTEGTKGTKREATFGAMTFENDEGTIKGQTSGFTDAQLADFNSRREELIGKIIEVQFNDLSKARGNDFWSLSHPRYIEIRNDKTETDTVEKAFKLREMAMSIDSLSQ